MGALYIIFAAIPVLAAIASFFPQLTGRGEPIPVGVVEYTVFAPKKYLVGGALGIGGFGILFLLLTDGALGIADERLALLLLAALLVGEVISVYFVIYYFSYRLTVRGGVIFYKLPARRELCVPIRELEGYLTKGSSAVLFWKGKKIYAEGAGTEILLSELESRNIKKGKP
ncbi:MAG: hypothetical protein E7640_00925 [Ruminococcaceae bacterium]|nr:hypothetical protein [Oscillospiraceae bacterium]